MADEDLPLSSRTKVKHKEPVKWPDIDLNTSDGTPDEDPSAETSELAIETVEDESSDQPSPNSRDYTRHNKDYESKSPPTSPDNSKAQDNNAVKRHKRSKTEQASDDVKTNNGDAVNDVKTKNADAARPSTSKQDTDQKDSVNKPSPNIDEWYSRTIRDDSREFESDNSDEDGNNLRRSLSMSSVTRYTADRYAEPVQRWHRDVRTGRRRCSAGDLFMAEQAGEEVRVLCRCGAGRRFLKRLVRGGTTCERRLVILHFIINGRPESLMFCRDVPPEHFREALLGAAGGRPCDLVFLRNQAGALIGLSPDLETNTPSTAYIVVVTRYNGAGGGVDGETGEEHSCVRPCSRPPPQTLTRDHIMCMGLLPNLELETEPICRHRAGGGRILDTRRPSEPHHQHVWQRFNAFRGVEVTADEVAALLTANVDCYKLTDEKILTLIIRMFVNLGFLTTFPIQESVLRNFLYEVYKHYNEVPFHNFRHSFCVAQMFYAISMSGKDLPLDDLTKLILLVSCICHDLDHPGYNNIYQIHARTDLALRYNDISPLENHHCSVAFRILQLHDCNIFRNFSDEDFRSIREGMIRCILATDMARHNEILAQFVEIKPPIIPSNKVNLNLLTMVLIKVADISNEVRPLMIAEPWLDRLLEEFFTQSDLEKRLGLPITPFMDREKVTKPTSQCAFIGLVLIPLFQALVDHYPELESLLITPAKDALAHYTTLAEEMSPSGSQSSNVNMPSTSGIQNARRNSTAVGGAAARDSTDAGAHSSDKEPPPGSPGSFVQQYCSETEVDVSEKALKFKIATEGSFDRRSYPSSRKGSREAGLSNVDLIRAFHYAASPSPPPLEEDENIEQADEGSADTLEAEKYATAAATSSAAAPEGTTGAAATPDPDDIEVVTEQPTRSSLLQAPSTSKSKGTKKSISPVKSSEKTSPGSGSSFQSVFGYRSIMSRLRVLTDKMTFRDTSAPSSPTRDAKQGRGRSGKDI